MASTPGAATTPSQPVANERESSSSVRGGISAVEVSHKCPPPPYPTWAPQFYPETVKSSRGVSGNGNGNITTNETATWNTSEGSDSVSGGMESAGVLNGYFSDADSDVAGAGVAWDEVSRSGKSLRSEEYYESATTPAACAGVGLTMKGTHTSTNYRMYII